MSRRRVVITGLGLVSPLGVGTELTWDAIVAGRSGAGPITLFDASEHSVRIAAEVEGFEPEQWLPAKELKKFDRFLYFGVAAADMALADAGLQVTEENADRIGVIMGSGIGGLPMMERSHQILMERGPRRVSPFFIPGTIINMMAGVISIRTGAKGPNSATCTACSSSAHAIGDALQCLRSGIADAMIAGGSEAVITPLAIAGFNSMKALSSRNDNPQAASRPWDRDRDGFLMGEGAGAVVLEELEHARRRGAPILAEVLGYGMSSDAYHISSPSEDGDGAIRVMRTALQDASVSPEQIDYINAHGTSTPQGDRVETLAVKAVFGDHASRLMVSSTKSMTGHLLGASGALEIALTVLAMNRSIVPPTINLDEPDPENDLDYVPNEARQHPVRFALSNSFGFGGTNASLVVGRAP